MFGGSSDRTEVNTYVAFDLRVIDTSTGTIAYSEPSRVKPSQYQKQTNLDLTQAPSWRRDSGKVDLSIENAKTTYDTTATTRALRAAMIGSVEYLDCVLYQKDECIDEYTAMDEKRKEDTLDSLNLF